MLVVFIICSIPLTIISGLIAVLILWIPLLFIMGMIRGNKGSVWDKTSNYVALALVSGVAQGIPAVIDAKFSTDKNLLR